MIISDKLYKDSIILSERILSALYCIYEADAMSFVFNKPEHKADWKKASHFYITTYQALIFRFMIELCKLFDDRTLNFNSFKNNLCKTGYSQSLIDNYNILKKIASKDFEAIKQRRDKLLAHTDNEFISYNSEPFYDTQTFLKGKPYNCDTIIELLNLMLKICNQVIVDYSGDRINCRFLADEDDFKRLFGYETNAEISYKTIIKNWM